MRKSVLLFTVALCCVVFGSHMLAADEMSAADEKLTADDMCVPMGDIDLEPLTEEAKRSEVSFPHALHFSYTCQECHHTWTGEEPVVGCSTSGCHDLTAAPKTKQGKPVKDPVLKLRYYKKAYHDMCIGCHKSIKVENKKMEAAKASLGEKLATTGPTGCNGCHPKE